MTIKKILIAICVMLPCMLCLQGCWPFDTGASGFNIFASTTVDGLTNMGDPGLSVSGRRQSNIIADGFGYLTGGHVETGGDGRAQVNTNNYGSWLLQRGGDSNFPDPLCGTLTYFADTRAGGTYSMLCQIDGPVVPDPNPFNAGAPPPAISFSGTAVSAQYGMPIVRFYNEGGNLLSSATASSVSGDGTWLQIPTPPEVISLYTGKYGAVIYVVNADSSLSPSSGALFTVTGNDPPPPDPAPCIPSPNYDCP